MKTMMMKFFRCAACAHAVLFFGIAAQAQIFSLSKDDMLAYTSQNPFERFADGRPKIPDALLERAKGMSAEEAWAIFNVEPGQAYRNQYADGFQVLHPGHKLVGRAFTVQFMPTRPDVAGVMDSKASTRGIPHLYNQVAIDMVQPGDVVVVDLFGKVEGGTIVGDNLFYYLANAAKAAGLVVDGSIRDLEGISEIDMPAYFRKAHPSAIANVMLTGINVPVRIGGVTVMPGDLVLGDPEGVYFIPPQLVKQAVDNADIVHIHDEWTKMMFATGKYKSSEIYGSPKDPELKKQYEEFLKKRLAEIRKSQ
jgi:regulator of RNase E activity RraA